MRTSKILRLSLLTVVTLSLAFIGVQAARQESQMGARGSSRGDSAVNGQAAYATTGVLRSIGEVIEESDLVVRAERVGVGDPVWNSPDGEDWTKDYEADPTAFLVPPIAVIPLKLKVSEVLLERAEEGSPSVTVGDELEVLLMETSIAQGEERIFFLGWTEMAMSKGFRKVWFCDEASETWTIDGERATPSSREQAFSVATAVMSGDLDGMVDQALWLGSLDLETLQKVISDEARQDGVNIAGFSQWPFEAAANKYYDEVDRDDPGAFPDPGDV